MKKSAAVLLLMAALFTESFAQKKADIVFTNDVHSHLENMSKVKVLVDRKLNKNPHTLLLDAGGSSMGTLYQTVFETQAVEFRMLDQLGFEATTMGDRDFDYGFQAFANMLDSARMNGNGNLNFVVCNVDWTKEDDATKIVKEAFDNYGGKDYVLLKKGDVNIAVIGVMGADAVSDAVNSGLTFTDQCEAVKKTIAAIKANEEIEQPDLIVCLSHSGTNENLAKKVPELDLIISGHSHTVLEKPVICGETVIVSAGCNAEFLGNLSLTQKENGRWQVEEYKLDNLLAGHPHDQKIEKIIAKDDRLVNREYLNNFGVTTNQVITEASYDMDLKHETGYLMADAIYDTVLDLEKTADVVIVSEKLICKTFKKGTVTVADVFETYPLGTGADNSCGYPLVAMYLNGKDLTALAEADCSLSEKSSFGRFYTSGMAYTCNPKRFTFDKVTGVSVAEPDGAMESVEGDRLYRVVTDIHTAETIGTVADLSHGMLKITPKDEKGNPITDWNSSIVQDFNKKELKVWVAISRYLCKLKVIPSYKDAEKTAITSEPSLNPAKFLRNPSKAGLLVRLAFLVGLLVIILVICAVIFVCKKNKAKKNGQKNQKEQTENSSN